MIKTQKVKKTIIASKLGVGDLFRVADHNGGEWFMRIHHHAYCGISEDYSRVFAVSIDTGIVDMIEGETAVVAAKKLKYTVK